ncbi:MAG: hypothetical protein GTN71_24525 [Anaerolineae bacterium]|nr:hypothetical protein [Anaerolineae bacterium]
MSTNIATQTESNVKTAQPEHSSGKSVRLHYLDWLCVLSTLDLESGPRPEGEIYEEREPDLSRFPHINCQAFLIDRCCNVW